MEFLRRITSTKRILSHLALVGLLVGVVYGHGRLVEPPSRASMWRYGFNTPKNYNDNELNCGGVGAQYSAPAKGRCGICGDPWHGGRPHEYGGPYATGTIVKTYKQGQIIEAVAEVTANHQGYFQFRLCPIKLPRKEATQECLNRFPLKVADGSGSTKYYIGGGTGKFSVKLRLPRGLTCEHCVLQWSWRCGNSWGVCQDGSQGIGCGNQETFRACADVAITPYNDNFIPPDDYPNQDDDDLISDILPVSYFTSPDKTFTPPIQSFDEEEEPTSFNEISPTPHSSFTVPHHDMVTGENRKTCFADPEWSVLPGMDLWCDKNCNHIPAYCPPGWCQCVSGLGRAAPKNSALVLQTSSEAPTEEPTEPPRRRRPIRKRINRRRKLKRRKKGKRRRKMRMRRMRAALMKRSFD